MTPITLTPEQLLNLLKDCKRESVLCCNSSLPIKLVLITEMREGPTGYLPRSIFGVYYKNQVGRFFNSLEEAIECYCRIEKANERFP